MLELKLATSQDWLNTVMADFDRFLLDHAAAEKKAAGMAVSMLSHYPDKIELVSAMAELAVEEMTHFREVLRIIHARGLVTGADEKDDYVNALRGHIRKGREAFFLDRLLVAGVIEARGAERFGLIAEALEPGPLKRFYRSITRSETRHLSLFVELAALYFPAQEVAQRLDELLTAEAALLPDLPLRPALH